jgi:hypothetical protein
LEKSLQKVFWRQFAISYFDKPPEYGYLQDLCRLNVFDESLMITT